MMSKACFCGGGQFPSACVLDSGDVYNCKYASSGVEKWNCLHWNENRVYRLVADLLDVDVELVVNFMGGE